MAGPRDLTYAEGARILCAHLGRPDAAYVLLPAVEGADVLAGYGFSADTARHYVEFGQALARALARALGAACCVHGEPHERGPGGDGLRSLRGRGHLGYYGTSSGGRPGRVESRAFRSSHSDAQDLPIPELEEDGCGS